MYDIIVADARSPRDGKFIEKLGLYNPNTDPATIELNADKAFEWVMTAHSHQTQHDQYFLIKVL